MTINALAAEIRQATQYQQNRQQLREQMLADLTVHHNEGLFVVSPELIAFLSAWTENEVYLEDQYHNPIKCNRAELLESAKQQYHKTLNRWHNLHEELKRVRKI